jgi:UDP-N-acetylglucosamine pyrophosphorylase
MFVKSKDYLTLVKQQVKTAEQHNGPQIVARDME